MLDAVIYVLAAWLGIVAGLWACVAIFTLFSRIGIRWWRGWLEDEVLASLQRIEQKVEQATTDKDKE